MTAHKHLGSAAAASAATADADPAAERAHRPGHLPVKALMARRAREAAGFRSPVQLALKLGVRVWLIKRHESRAFSNSPTLDHMLADRAYGLHLAGEVAREHDATVEPLPVVESMPQYARDSRVQIECLDVARVVAEGGADGTHDRADLVKRERELVELIAAARSDLAWVRQELKR